ncbi:hypothetical protein ACJRO7_035871 [Eucalyptus globulus]|uniref:Aldehyde dehydrogenase domain-containing protein n=1 Tax=Eucalyptus globulus TaxID=34317 RepID=A0ABD3JAB1_EUCGL
MGEVEESLAEVRQEFKSGSTRSVSWRKSQLRAIINLVQDNEENIFKALYQDLGKHPVECYRDEVGAVLKSAKYSLGRLEKWMAPKKGRLPLLFFPSSGEVISEPLGVVLIFASWNFPIALSLDPLIGAISAGNTAVLKPSELAPACSSFLADTIPHYLDCRAIKVVSGGADVGDRLLQQKWDKIFFTGSPRVGRIVMSAAARHLTPVTLELGGKCPTILDTLSSPSEIKIAVKRIVGAKWGPCSGQACISTDYVLVERKFAPTLIDLLKLTIKNFYGDEPRNSKNMCKIINKHHFERLRNLIEEPAVAASIVHGGSLHEKEQFIEPSILLDPPLDAEIMTEEIFGPLLPIITVRNFHQFHSAKFLKIHRSKCM